MLRGIQRVLSPRHVFDPAHSQRVFRLAAPDFMLTAVYRPAARLRRKRRACPSSGPRRASRHCWMSPKVRSTSRSCPQNSVCPTASTSEAVGALEWRCFGRQGHPAFSQWGRRHLDKMAAPCRPGRRQSDKPGQCCGLGRRSGANDCGLGPHFSAIAPVLARSDLIATLPAIAMAETHPSLSSGEQGSPISNRAASACDDLEHRSKQRSRYRVAARSIAAHHQKQICERTVRGATRRNPYPSRVERSTCEGAYFAADI